jgi:CSLREA domain-containing protein
MRNAMRRFVATASVVALLLSLGAQPAAATAADIHVNTTSDTDTADAFCSLREAIIATTSHKGSTYNGCTPGASGTDTIYLDVSPINVTTDLPTFGVPININSNLGGPRAEIHGPGSGTALKLQGGGASTVRNLKIDNFATAIYSISSSLTVTGSIIGPNSSKGIWLEGNGGTATIGGTTGVSTNACTGDCNLISGNASAGILSAGNTLTVKGNWFGVDATGTSAVANGEALEMNGVATATIGGTTAAERNIISGSTTRGLWIGTCTCTVQGNYIGTNAAGNAAIPNVVGIVAGGQNQTIGGTAAGAGNVISGNEDDGIYVLSHQSGTLNILGNKIGVKAGGGALPNGGNGINLDNGEQGDEHVVIGSTTAGAGNVIAFNSVNGVRINGSVAKYDSVRGNSIHDNDGLAIFLENGANELILPPTIAGVGPVHGTACNGCHVDVFSDSSDEGKVFEGTVDADGSGNWSFPESVAGPYVTATATNGSGDTSQYSSAVFAASYKPDGRIRKGSGSFVGNNIYNITGLNQTKSGTTTRGNTITFTVSVQNDATSADAFKVVPTGTNTTGYTIKYFHGTTDITSAVVAGTFQTPTLPAAGKYGIKVRVTIGSTAATGSSVSRLVTITSVGDNSKQDAVKLIAKRS